MNSARLCFFFSGGGGDITWIHGSTKCAWKMHKCINDLGNTYLNTQKTRGEFHIDSSFQIHTTYADIMQKTN